MLKRRRLSGLGDPRAQMVQLFNRETEAHVGKANCPCSHVLEAAEMRRVRRGVPQENLSGLFKNTSV